MLNKLIEFFKKLFKIKPKQIFCVVCLKEIDIAKERASMKIMDNPVCIQCRIRKFKANLRSRGALRG